jgi:hypothetical protein
MAEVNTIQVLVLEPDESMPGRRMVPGMGQVAARVLDVPIDTVKQGIRKVTEQVSEIVRDMTDDERFVSLDQIAIDLNISANGSVQWIAGVGGAVGSTVTLTFKVASDRIEVES